MPLEPELLKAVLEKPDDDAPRLGYAAWCDTATEDPVRLRGEFIRLEIELARTPYNPLRLPVKAWNREERLLGAHRVQWSGGLAARVADFSYQRGFVEWIRLPAAAFLEYAPQLFALAPIRHVDLTGAKGLIEQLADSPHLERLRSLALENQALGDAHAEVLALSPRMGQLRWLSLANNQVGAAGVEAFCRSTGLPRLAVLGLEGNPFDPRERFGADDNLITAQWMTKEGASLELMYGRKAWLHGVGNTVGGWFPSRFSPIQSP